jgi:periplasmic protein TonB
MKLLYLTLTALICNIAIQAQSRPSASAMIDSVIAIVDTTLDKVEIESSFPGGDAGWIRFLNTHLVYPPKAVRKSVQGTVVVQFIVEKDGSLSNIEAISGPALLQEAAVTVLKESPRWKPAFQNNKKVKSYKKQPITFKLQ